MSSVIRRAADLQTVVSDWRASRRTVGFVPTMGALHEGHVSLVRASLEECDKTVVSIFVNPLQFDRADDLESYPRTEEADRTLLQDLGVDVIWMPRADAVYPPGFATQVTQRGLPDHLCGASRPGHFDGVLTVVLKLFNVVRADRAYFGRKDFQQAAVIRRMVVDLDLSVEIRVMPIVREDDGLALSSRNVRLTPEQRAEAPRIHRALEAARTRFAEGDLAVGSVGCALAEDLDAIPGARLDYARICDPETLEPRAPDDEVRDGDLLAVAVWFGDVRLIDNVSFESRREP